MVPLHAMGFVDGSRVIAASISGRVYEWDVSAKAAVDYACRVAGRDLTHQEWTDAFGDVPYRSVCGHRSG